LVVVAQVAGDTPQAEQQFQITKADLAGLAVVVEILEMALTAVSE
jgi:hypothetical protein